MLKIYGSMLCPDCVKCREDLDQAGVEYTYLDFSADLRNLKEFLKLRDTHPVFETARAEGTIGVPCIVDDDGAVTLDWSSYVGQAYA